MKLSKQSKILIIGLGLLGGSYAKALKQKGFNVSAITLKEADIDFALENNIIDYGTTKVDAELIKNSNIVIFALYPSVFCEWIEKYANLFKEGTVITDVTGVKGGIVQRIQDSLPSGVEFISAHPMAGRETSGIQNADPSIFKDANYIVVPTEKNSLDAIEICCQLGEVLGFKTVSKLSVDEHDRMIAFLSQLTHCIAVSLMCANDNKDLVKYTGDSFRDLTRIANINDEMWSELFLSNATVLLDEMDTYRKSFDELYNYIKTNDREGLRSMMKTSTQRRRWFDKEKE